MERTSQIICREADRERSSGLKVTNVQRRNRIEMAESDDERCEKWVRAAVKKGAESSVTIDEESGVLALHSCQSKCLITTLNQKLHLR